MSGTRIALLFLYAFASMTLPILLLVSIDYSKVWTPVISMWAFAYVAFGLIQIFIVFPMMGSWAASVKPESTVRLTGEELEAKLLSLNDDKLPFTVTRDSKDPDRLVALWKIADERWMEIFAARRLSVQYELRMKVEEKKGVVLAQDNLRRFEYTGGVGRRGASFSRKFSFFRGISLFQYERGIQYGVIYKDGALKIDYSYNYRFDMAEVKTPIIQIVTSSGWEFRPVIFIR
jgi:hypothetical protein